MSVAATGRANMSARPSPRGPAHFARSPLFFFVAGLVLAGGLVGPVRGNNCPPGICGCTADMCVTDLNGDNLQCRIEGTPSACGDPHMTGLNGETFDWHGIPGQTFCLVSDNHLQLNVHLTGQTGLKATEEGTWFDALGVLYTLGGKTHTLSVEFNETADLDDDANLVISLDGVSLSLDSFSETDWHHTFGELRVFRSTAVGVVLSRLVENGVGLNVAVDGLMNVTLVTDTHEYPTGKHFDFHFHHMTVSSHVHGVLGQTFQPSRAKAIKAAMERNGPALDASDLVDGVDESYQTASLLDPFCKYGRFGRLDTRPSGPGASFRRRLAESMKLVDAAPYQMALEEFSCRRNDIGQGSAHTCFLPRASPL